MRKDQPTGREEQRDLPLPPYRFRKGPEAVDVLKPHDFVPTLRQGRANYAPKFTRQ